MSKRRVVIFTEAGQNIGFGHLTRCSALYDEIDKRGIEVILVVFGKEIENLLGKRKNRIVDWKDLEFLRSFLNKTDYIIIDSYLATLEVYDFCSKNTARCLYVDDTNRVNYPKGIILNPSLSGNIKYNTKNEVLQGKDYIILRKEFTEDKIAHFEKEIDVLITLGGTDIRDLIPKLLDILSSINNKLKIVVVTGKISENIKKLKTNYIEIFSNIEALEMRNLILKSKFIICGCGQSIYEMLALKATFLPILIVDNQISNKEGLLKYQKNIKVINWDDIELEKCISKFLLDINFEQIGLNNIKYGTKNIINHFIGEI
jgi:possible CMP-sialic acid synthetase, neuA